MAPCGIEFRNTHLKLRKGEISLLSHPEIVPPGVERIETSAQKTTIHFVSLTNPIFIHVSKKNQATYATLYHSPEQPLVLQNGATADWMHWYRNKGIFELLINERTKNPEDEFTKVVDEGKETRTKTIFCRGMAKDEYESSTPEEYQNDPPEALPPGVENINRGPRDTIIYFTPLNSPVSVKILGRENEVLAIVSTLGRKEIALTEGSSIFWSYRDGNEKVFEEILKEPGNETLNYAVIGYRNSATFRQLKP